MGYIRKALEKGYLKHPGLHAVLTVCLRFCLCWMMPMLLAASFCQQAATMSAYKFTPRAVASPDAPQKLSVRKRARSVQSGCRWLGTGMAPYSRFAATCVHAWRKVRLTKQHNVDLTTDGLWAMPLNTGWVPAKARRLQDWEKLEKHVPIQQAGGCVPQWGPCPCESGQQ